MLTDKDKANDWPYLMELAKLGNSIVHATDTVNREKLAASYRLTLKAWIDASTWGR